MDDMDTYQLNPKDPIVISPSILARLREENVKGRRRFVDPEGGKGTGRPGSYGPQLVERSTRVWAGARGGDIEGIAMALGFNPALDSQFGSLTQSERWRTMAEFEERIRRYKRATRIVEETIVVQEAQPEIRRRARVAVDFGTPLEDANGDPQFFTARELRSFKGWSERRGSLKFKAQLTARGNPRTFEVFPGDPRFALFDGQVTYVQEYRPAVPQQTRVERTEVHVSEAPRNAKKLSTNDVITSQRFIDAMLFMKDAPRKEDRTPKDNAPDGKIAKNLVILGYRNAEEKNEVGKSSRKARFVARR